MEAGENEEGGIKEMKENNSRDNPATDGSEKLMQELHRRKADYKELDIQEYKKWQGCIREKKEAGYHLIWSDDDTNRVKKLIENAEYLQKFIVIIEQLIQPFFDAALQAEKLYKEKQKWQQTAHTLKDLLFHNRGFLEERIKELKSKICELEKRLEKYKPQPENNFPRKKMK